MARKSIRCKLVTPTAAVVDGQVAYASVPLHDGLMGFLPGRAPILARLGMGELRLDFADTDKGQGGSDAYFVDGGFLKMADDNLTILAENAIPSENLTIAAAEAEMAKARTDQERQRARVKMQLVKTRGI
jgi:F-type H+-transporting ATPase subunit epsilon